MAEAPLWDFACPDWVERLKQGRSLLPDLPLDQAEAARAVAMFDKLRLPDVPGQPTMGEAAGEFVRDIIRAVFGSLDEDRVRQVREVFELVPKKNMKTTGGAAIMLVALLMNERPRAEFVLVGPTQEVADIAFQQASGMIDADEYLKARFHVAEHTKTIYDRVLKSRLKIKTFDMKVATGSKPAGLLIDEVHLLSTIAGAARVIGQLRGGMIANPEAFMIMITTQSDEAPSGVFKSELDYARGVRDGRITGGHTLAMLYEMPEAMQIDPSAPWKDPANWPMVLPNLGRSITLERLIEEFETAQEKGIEELRRWASQHLNIEIGLGLHSARWRGADFWEIAAEGDIAGPTGYRAMFELCEVMVAGVDGGGLDDLYGLALAGREKVTKRWLFWAHAWVQRDVLTLRPEIAARLQDFEKDGDLTFCDDGMTDVEGIAAILAEVHATGLLPEKSAIGMDPQGVAALHDALIEAGILPEQMVAVSQGFRLSSAVWTMERKLKDGTLAHAGSRLLNWCVGNARAEQRGNAVLITKETAGKAKIDPLVACFNAAKLLERSPEAAGANGGLDGWLASMVVSG